MLAVTWYFNLKSIEVGADGCTQSIARRYRDYWHKLTVLPKLDNSSDYIVAQLQGQIFKFEF